MRQIFLALGLCVFVLASGLGIGCGDGETTVPGGVGGAADAGDGGGMGGADGGQCFTASFVSPKDGATLNEANDTDHDCSNGFTTDITVAVAVPDGTSVQLLSGGAALASTTVSGASATFSKVQLDTSMSSTLTLRIGDNPDCNITATFTVDCNNKVPSCSISQPTLSPTHPELNGVPVAQGGDRVSADGAPYQAAFEVTTNIADGRQVSISVDSSTTLVTAVATGGVAKFAGITLSPDGDHSVVATCFGTNGKVGTSAVKTFPVDSTPPDLAVVSPTDGQFFGPSADVDPSTPGLQFKVCGTTKAADALDLPASLGAGQQNFCAGIGTASPACMPAVTGGAGAGDGGCVNVTCPGGAPFDINVTLTDSAGNPTVATVKGVTCASNLPSVQIIDPVDGTGADVNTHILDASMTTTRVDQDATKSGAQYTVVACTDTQGGSAQLLTGTAGGTLQPLGSPLTVVAAKAADQCPGGLGYIAKFVKVTLPETTEKPGGSLQVATGLQVDVTAPSTAKGASPEVDVWVDSVAPTIGPWSPNPLCGKKITGTAPVTRNLTLTSTVAPVSGTLTNNGSTTSFSCPTLNNGRVDCGNVTFGLGDNDVAVTAMEPSGNTGALQSPCVVSVGDPPVVTWTSPTTVTRLNAATDGDSGKAGWQGTLTVKTDVGGSGGTVQFSIDVGGTVTNLGSPVSINASGVATLAGQTIPEGDPVKIIATTSNIAGRGVGTAMLTKTVDVVVPGAVTGLAASVKDRRQTTFHLGWTASGDGGKPAFTYDVRVSKSPITAGNFTSATSVLYTGAPAAPGQPDGVDVPNQMIETDYYFAVEAMDKAGNHGAIVAVGPTRATFNTTMLSSAIKDERFGFGIDGSSSINGDALSDILVASVNGSAAYAYFGSSSGFSSKPDVTFQGASGTLFGFSVAVVGDIDGDGFQDVAIGAILDGDGKVFIFRGRSNWPAIVSQPDYVISVDQGVDAAYAGANFGFSIARLGDFNGDGAPDFAVGARGYNGLAGSVSIVLGVPSGKSFPAVVSIPQSDGTRTITIHGDPAFTGGVFGANVAGLGKFYNSPGNTLVVSAPRASSNGARSGRVYAFRGQPGISGLIDIATADNVADGQGANYTLGSPLSPLGNIFGTAAPDIGVGESRFPFAAGGRAVLYFGNSSVGPFGALSATFTDAAATQSGDGFGEAVMGCGFNGTAVTTSLIGDSQPDVVLSAVREAGAPAKLYFLTSQDLSMNGPKDVASAASVIYSLPNDWRGVAPGSSIIKDLNGDGYGDVAVGEYYYNVPAPGYNGRVLVLW